MRIVVIGAGAMGASYGGLLARSGHEVAMIDVWEAHVDAINRNGLKLQGVRGDHTIGLRAQSTPAELDPVEVAIIFVDSNHTDQAAETAAQVLSPDGFAITFQNGIGNVEALQAVLGNERVLGGSSMCSAAVRAPGHVVLTHHGPTTLGETDGSDRGRALRLAEALSASGLETKPERDIMSTIWTKFALNCSINAICATAGLRLGEVVRLPALDDFQHRIIDEVLAVTEAKGIRLTYPDLRRTVKDHCFRKFSKPDAAACGSRQANRDRRAERRAGPGGEAARRPRTVQRGPGRAAQGTRAARMAPRTRTQPRLSGLGGPDRARQGRLSPHARDRENERGRCRPALLPSPIPPRAAAGCR